jgi:hypothetical protein
MELKLKSMKAELDILSPRKSKPSQPGILDLKSSARDWHRVEFLQHQVQYERSNFDKELARINSLQLRNSVCLKKYLDLQKMWVEMKPEKVSTLKKLHATSE